MKCFLCVQSIAGVDYASRVEYRMQLDDSLCVYGQGMPDGSLTKATGVLVRVYHRKCYFANKRREQLQAARRDDAPSTERQGSDWRHQETHDVRELIGESDRDSGGAGAEGS